VPGSSDSCGQFGGTVADPKIIFAAVRTTCRIILAHNHPSGNLTASQADIELTKKVRDGGKLPEIQSLDHIIVTKEGYFSFADEGLIPPSRNWQSGRIFSKYEREIPIMNICLLTVSKIEYSLKNSMALFWHFKWQ
jgi:RadC-like JAB domain